MEHTINLARPARAWRFVPTLYFAQGLPYSVVMVLSLIMYKRLGIGNAQMAFWTSLLQLPWVLKPLWSPLVEVYGTKRRWVARTQLLVSLSLAALSFTLGLSHFFAASLALLALMALFSATHDIATDGFYILALSSRQQALFSGVRNTCYRAAMIFCQGALVVLAGVLESVFEPRIAWSLIFLQLALLLGALAFWHRTMLPRPAADQASEGVRFDALLAVFRSFFAKPGIVWILAFLLTYRLGEAQLLRIATPFLLDARSDGGLGLNTAELGFGYGVLGVAALLAGGLLGGLVVARFGLRRWLLPMFLALNLPNLLYVALAIWQPTQLLVVWSAIAIEQFGYGFGFTAYMLAMIAFAAEGQWQTSHYALCTGFMALGVMLPGLPAGYLQELWGYPMFFAFCVLCAVPALFTLGRLRRFV